MMDRLCLSLVADQTTMHRHSHRDSLAASGMTKRYVRTCTVCLASDRLWVSPASDGAPHTTRRFRSFIFLLVVVLVLVVVMRCRSSIILIVISVGSCAVYVDHK